MEGIREGMAGDRCFYCALLYPDLELCPECGGRFRYQSATLMNDLQMHERFDELACAVERRPGRGSAEALLRFLYRLGDEGLELLAKHEGLSLERLRAEYEHES